MPELSIVVTKVRQNTRACREFPGSREGKETVAGRFLLASPMELDVDLRMREVEIEGKTQDLKGER